MPPCAQRNRELAAHRGAHPVRARYAPGAQLLVLAVAAVADPAHGPVMPDQGEHLCAIQNRAAAQGREPVRQHAQQLMTTHQQQERRRVLELAVVHAWLEAADRIVERIEQAEVRTGIRAETEACAQSADASRRVRDRAEIVHRSFEQRPARAEEFTARSSHSMRAVTRIRGPEQARHSDLRAAHRRTRRATAGVLGTAQSKE